MVAEALSRRRKLWGYRGGHQRGDVLINAKRPGG